MTACISPNSMKDLVLSPSHRCPRVWQIPWTLSRLTISGLLSVLSCTLQSCDAGSRPANHVVGRQPVRIHSPEPESVSGLSQWHLTETLRIPVTGSLEPGLIESVDDIATDKRGVIYLLDRRNKKIVQFDSRGKFVRVVPRSRILQDPIGIATDRVGRLWIVDPAGPRYLRVDSSGEAQSFARSVRGYSVPWRGGIAKDGQFYDVSLTNAAGSPQEIVIYDTDLHIVRAVRIPKLSTVQTFTFGREPYTTTASVPFTGELLWSYDGDQRIWIANSAEYSLFVLDLKGDTLNIIDRSYQSIPIKDAERDSAIRALSWFVRSGGRIAENRIPTVHPALRALFLDGNLFVWVVPRTDRDHAEAQFDVFTSAGQLTAIVHVGRQLITNPLPRIVNGFLYAAIKDSLGRIDIARFQISRK